MSVYARLTPRGPWLHEPEGPGCRREIHDAATGAVVAVQRQRPGARPNTSLNWCELPDGRATAEFGSPRASLEALAALLSAPSDAAPLPMATEEQEAILAALDDLAASGANAVWCAPYRSLFTRALVAGILDPDGVVLVERRPPPEAPR